MNTPNNKRKRDSQEKIEKTFVQLIQKKNISEISVSTICEIAKLNRSTFYANYIDVYDLVEKEQVVMCEMKDLEKHSVMIRKSAMECLNKMKKKYNIPIYVIINVAIREGIAKLEQRIK